jgi:uncharacterized membrane protein YeaQ/YmgE (transglycosylase-associated protein family)
MESLALLVSLIFLSAITLNSVVGILAAKFIDSIFMKILAGIVLPVAAGFLFQNPVVAVFMLGGYFVAFWVTKLFL